MEQPLLVGSKSRVDITQKYDLKAEVGEGTYGLVYQAEFKGKQTKVAIKKFRSTKEGEEGEREIGRKERLGGKRRKISVI